MITFSSCNQKRIEFTMYIDASPVNLDPQIASSPSEITAVIHLFNGLFRIMPDGKISANAAEDYSVSDDGLVYTIKLKQGQKWQTYKGENGEITPDLTAYDFEYGIQRVFLKETKSPHADSLSSIENSKSILNGTMPISALGVKATDALTLQITLAYPDPTFIQRLCSTGAMPCNKEFFESTKGAYGLSGKTLLANGDFAINSWQSTTGIGLKKLTSQKNEINYLRLILPDSKVVESTTAISRLEDEITSGELLTGTVTDHNFNATVFSNTSWVLAFNCAQKPFDNQNIRLALATSAHNAQIEVDESSLLKSEGIVPPSIGLLDENYRKLAGNTLPTANSVQVFRQGMEELSLKKISNITVLVPNDGPYASIFEEINQQWQKELSVFFSTKAVSRDELAKAVENGKYQIAFIPLSQTENDVLAQMNMFTKKDNVFGFENVGFNNLIHQIQTMPRGNERTPLYFEAERMLQNLAPIIPLYYETGTYLYSSSVTDIVLYPHGPIIDVSFASKSS